MTALKEYQRLECTGLWRDTPDAQRREVIVAFGDATLVISDARNTRALAHWSLPAIIRLNPGEQPAIFAPGTDAGEALEIEDETMVAAIAKVHALIEARRPHPGRLRTVLLGIVLALVIALGLFWMPRTVIEHTSAALPHVKRQEIGLAALADMTRLTGLACDAPEGRAALARLSTRLLGPGGRIIVLPEGLDATAHLPGGLILVPREAVEDESNPDILAGKILAEDLRRQAGTPMADLLRHAGLRATLRLLTTGDLPGESVAGYGETVLAVTPRPVDLAKLVGRFKAADVSSTAYAYSVDPSGEAVLALIETDPFRTTSAPELLLSDTDWVALQGICDG
ncbi:hypothetical protein OEZ71_14535 [Defluviimonas sp. WL0050]|uniref:Uncharacterized protein n=1 Tax=Albidovulum litorale TaxID=2984134 RepID=A0ABT2ZQS8_9RHOB|nr:hypothetical protein [Defluviimonas sp. WL0050]MCV2873515.1 hypothetical protein [Defluviimonas sp. WL0050]